MSNGYGAPAPSPGERWSVNMPVAIGAVFVFLVGVIAWVVLSEGDGDGDGFVATATSLASTTSVVTGDTATPTVASSPATPPPTSAPAPGTTSPPPMPNTVAVSETVSPPPAAATSAPTVPSATAAPAPPPTTGAPTTGAPTTTASGPTTTAATPAGNGDLGIDGIPISRPSCNGGYITVIASAIGGQASAAGIAAVIKQYPRSSYLRTDLTCASLNPSVNGQPIYVVYFGPFSLASEACAARADGPDGAYPRRLSNDLKPDHTVDCS